MYVNGKNAQYTVIGAMVLLLAIIASITVIVLNGQVVPQEYSMIATALVGALAGFLTGTRVVPPDVSAEIKRQPLNEAEIEVLRRES